MNKSTFIPVFILFLITMNGQNAYPPTEKQPTSENYFGTQVSENYAWLEDDRSIETKNWVKKQNDFTDKYLDGIKDRDAIKQDLESLYNYEKSSIPFQLGDYLYYYKNDGLQAHHVLFRRLASDEKSKEEVFLDPNTFSKDGSISLMGWEISASGKYLVYETSEGGADWTTAYIKDIESGKMLKDKIEGLKFSNTDWWGDKGIFYSTYESPKGSKLSDKTQRHLLKFHKIGSKQEDDIIIFGNEETPSRYVKGEVSEDNKYLFIYASETTNANALYFADLGNRSFKPQPMMETKEARTSLLFTSGDMAYFITDYKAPNKKIVGVDMKMNPSPSHWTDLVSENQMSMTASYVGGKIFCTYMKDANDIVVVYGEDGSLLHEINLPSKGTVSGFYGEKNNHQTYFQFENYITPPITYKLNIDDFKYEVFSKSKINWNPNDYVTEQYFYLSKDGVEIPITVSYKKGTKMDGTNPTILYGYGGFGVSMQPYFSVFRAYWISKGGIFAVPNLRGGGEYGKDWHDMGTKMNKINVFEDFVGAANFLTTNKFTSREKLALSGGSNGGLLVGAVMTRKPDLAAVALPAVGVLDMLKYHTFTSGAGWAYDYGTAEDSKEMFDYLYSYSPVHNVREGACYPATLITTGDHDDRVVPAHSFKFAAELQDKQRCDKPILIRIETNAGHGAGKSTDVLINEYADVYAFTWNNMRATSQPSSYALESFQNNEIKDLLSRLRDLDTELQKAQANGNPEEIQKVEDKVIDFQKELAKYRNEPEFPAAVEYFKMLRAKLLNN